MQLPADFFLQFQRDGFVIARSVFSPSEIDGFRAAVVREAERAKRLGRMFEAKGDEIVPVGDLQGREGLRSIVFDDRLLRVARTLLGRDGLVYFGDSSVMVGGDIRGYHKDNSVRDRASHPDWQSPYTLLRMGIYLQDHERFSGGLKVRRGSHLFPDVTTGAIVAVPTRPGDVVIWSLRTTHSGHTVRLRGAPWLPLQPRFEARLPKALRIPEPCTRLAAFITYGLDDAHLKRYIDKHRDLVGYPENYLYKSWLHSYGGEELDRLAVSKGCTFLRPIPEYGSRFGDERYPAGSVSTLPGPAEHYEARGMEAFIQGAGRIVRGIGRLSSRVRLGGQSANV